MSNLEATTLDDDLPGATVMSDPVRELLAGRDVPLGESTVVRRLLPGRHRRMVGAWCFLDHFGPEDITGMPGMQVPPHPHTGLQTVTWLVDGEIRHRDSLGNNQLIRPGELNLMTSGRAIAHSEESPTDHGPMLHGVQLWVALPDRSRAGEPAFEHHEQLPAGRHGGLEVTVFVGELAGLRSPARHDTPLLGAELRLDVGAAVTLDLERDFEHAVLALTPGADVDGGALQPGSLLYLGPGQSALALRADSDARLLLLGGEPFDEQIVMWWNFVARSHDEIVAQRAAWVRGELGTVQGYPGDRLPAPPMPTTRLKPRGRVG